MVGVQSSNKTIHLTGGGNVLVNFVEGGGFSLYSHIVYCYYDDSSMSSLLWGGYWYLCVFSSKRSRRRMRFCQILISVEDTIATGCLLWKASHRLDSEIYLLVEKVYSLNFLEAICSVVVSHYFCWVFRLLLVVVLVLDVFMLFVLFIV